uniref:Death domain-containing protein n=2 Tax=Amphimedon queenslandica TaxID=400682 RepID=A0A1X7TYE5_AMPQE
MSDKESDDSEKPIDACDKSKEDKLLIELQQEIHVSDRANAYKKALAEGAMDVAYSRVLFLGTAGVGKTSFKRSLMKLPWEPNTTSTVVADVSRIRPFTRGWRTLEEDQWRVVSYEDEIKELAGLILAVYKKEPDATSPVCNDSFQPKQEINNEISYEVEKIISDALSYIKDHDLSENLKPQPFLHFWDCGGQLPFLEILPVFLTSRTLFFLIFDAEKDLKLNWQSVINIEGESLEQEEVPMTTLDYMLSWMANIHGHLMTYDNEGSFCAFPRMYCVGTHGDRVKDRKSEIKRELERKYQGKDFSALIEGTVIVDNTTSGQGEAEDPSLQALREAVVGFTQKKLVLKTPLSWVLFRKVIQVLSKKFNVINFEDASIIGAASKIPPEDVPHALMFYHELGVLLFYPQIDGIKDKIVINPNYFVDALGEIFPLSVNPDRERYHMEWEVFQKYGILVQPLYIELWNNYKDISPEFFIEVLVHFRIAVEIKTDKYPSHSKQYFMPLVLKSTRVNSSSTLPSDSIQAAPLHITFNSGYVPPGFFTRFVVVLANKMELCFEKDIYRNHVTFRYQDPNCNSIEHVTVTDCTDDIQINVIHHPSEQDSVSFKKICQDVRVLLEDAAKEVEDILKKCASGCTVDNKPTQYIFTKKFKYVCTSCPSNTSSHYIKLPPTNQNQLSQVFCENNKSYRSLTENEKVWFKDTSQFFSYNSSSARQSQSFIDSTPLVTTTISSIATAVPAASQARNNPTSRENEGVISTCSSDVSCIEDTSTKLDITDLDDVRDELQSIDYTEWKDLGLSLGLYYNTLEAIEEKCRGNARKCLLECMAAWLKGEDKVRQKGGPSWSSLAAALEKNGANNVASNIRAKYI